MLNLISSFLRREEDLEKAAAELARTIAARHGITLQQQEADGPEKEEEEERRKEELQREAEKQAEDESEKEEEADEQQVAKYRRIFLTEKNERSRPRKPKSD